MSDIGEGRGRQRRRRFAPRSFRGVIVTSTVAVMTVAMLVIGIGIRTLLDHTTSRDIDRVLVDRSSAMITVLDTASTDTLVVPPDTLEPGVRVYDAQGRLVSGTIENEARDAADELGTVSAVTTVNVADVRLRATPFTTHSGVGGVLVVSQETDPYERSESYALLAIAGLSVLAIGATALIALRVTKQALAPVTQMAQRAADWSEHDLSQRFGLGPPTNELAALGETLDNLLDRVASVIRAEQRLTSELAHELRTPLTSIQGAADLALLRGAADPATRRDLEQISASARTMTAVIATLLELARGSGPSRAESTCTVADVVVLLTPAARDDVTIDDATTSGARVAAPAGLVARAVQPLVDNAVRHARARVVLTTTESATEVVLVVTDDGPGVDPPIRATLFEPGASGRGGPGLGLGIARRVARSFGAEIALLDPAPGASFAIHLPRR